jgi:hypothetical protein
MRNYKKKKIWLNGKKTKYCFVKLFKCKKDMQAEYRKESPHDDLHDKTLGVSLHRVYVDAKSLKMTPCTGIVLLSVENCGAGVACHEIMHAVLWAHKHSKNKKQHPIFIKSMDEEEEILHNFSYAIRQFYNWFYKVTAK